VLSERCSGAELEARTQSMKNGVVLSRVVVDDIHRRRTARTNVLMQRFSLKPAHDSCRPASYVLLMVSTLILTFATLRCLINCPVITIIIMPPLVWKGKYALLLSVRPSVA